MLAVLVDGGMIAFGQLTTATSHFLSQPTLLHPKQSFYVLLLVHDKCMYIRIMTIHNAGLAVILTSRHYCGLSHYAVQVCAGVGDTGSGSNTV